MGLKDVEYEITPENAMNLCKGKTKVEGVGKVCTCLFFILFPYF